MPPQENTNSPKGYSLHIGVNEIDPEHYAGWDGALKAPEQDARAMLAIAETSKFEKSVMLLTKKAKRKTVVKEILNAAKALIAGDLFLLTYSGHGGQIDDLNNDESDKKDETWCLYDGQLLDDEIYWCLSKFKKGVRILAIIDSCHSGTNTKAILAQGEKEFKALGKMKLAPADILEKTVANNATFYQAISTSVDLENVQEKIEASVIHISACQDDEVAYDGEPNSDFTQTLLFVWDQGNFQGNYRTFLKMIDEILWSVNPNYLQFGQRLKSFSKSTPFSI